MAVGGGALVGIKVGGGTNAAALVGVGVSGGGKDVEVVAKSGADRSRGVGGSGCSAEG